jgi:restriction system protein
MTENWKEYQEEAAEFFGELGFDAKTDETLEGVRTKHDIDVVVRSQHLGFDILWLVECKHWKTKVSKLHVLGLRQIVADLGADRGILLCEVGFQSGAIEAAGLTNIYPTSLADFKITSSDQINSMRIRDLFDRIESCNKRYWDLPKADRIEHGLRPDSAEVGYDGQSVIGLVTELLGKALRASYPITCDSLTPVVSMAALVYQIPETINSIQKLLRIVEPLVLGLESKLTKCESGRPKSPAIDV